MEGIKRRTFLKQSLKVGACLSFVGLYPGSLMEQYLAFAGDTEEEKKKAKLAKYTFHFSSPYITENYLTTPHAHLEIKALVEKYTKNKIHVIIRDGGKDGIGSSLANSVKFGKTQGALLSVSNIAPKVPELDILNIPFWSSGEKEYTRLFNSQLWKDKILSKTYEDKLQVLFPYVVGARTASTTKKYNKTIKTPEDFVGVKFRIPGSESLKVFYTLTKAKPQKIAWKNCAKTAALGRYQALDPSIAGLYSGPGGLKNHIGVISEIESVHDGWVCIGNTDFIASLDTATRKEFMDAFEEIQNAQLNLYKQSKEFCSKEFIKLGTKIYTPTTQEKEVLAKAFGHTNPAWEPVKKKLLGNNGVKIFDEFYKIATG